MSDAVWVVRGGDNNELASQVKSKKAVALGFSAVPDLSGLTTRHDIVEVVRDTYPGGSPTRDGQLYRFVREIQAGDYVLTPEWVTKEIHISRCSGPYKFDSSIFGEQFPHIRPVEYVTAIPRKHFSQIVRNTLGSC